jgi:hypothetical protein
VLSPGAIMVAGRPRAKERARKSGKIEGAALPSDPGRGIADWRRWGVVGAVLVSGVVAWKLLGSSYEGDVRTLCNAETASGFTVEHDMSKVTAYVRQHLDTPEGNELFSTLSDAKLAERATHLQSEAARVGVPSCPVVEAYERLGAQEEYHADIQHLCSSAAFPHLGEADDAGRLQRLEDWIVQAAQSPRTKELGDALRQGTPADRAKLLRQTATGVDVYRCDLARTLESPLLPAKGSGPPMVRPFAEPQIIGMMKPEELAKALVGVTPAMNECYRKGLAKKADLHGKLAVNMKIDTAGKVAAIAPAEQTLAEPETATCILRVLKGMQFPKNPGPLVSVLIPLELTTRALPATGSARARAPGASGVALPLAVPPSLARP